MSGKIYSLLVLLSGLAMASAAADSAGGGGPEDSRGLAGGFLDPPAAAKPAVYWVWLNGNVSLPQLTRDLEQFKARGIGKAYIFECGARDPERIVPAGPAFMGPESVKAIGHAVREATRLGIELGLTTSSSWNAGGSWVTPKHASMGLYESRKAVRGPSALAEALPSPAIPEKAPRGPDGLPAYFKDVAVLAIPGDGRSSTTIDHPGAVVDLTSRLDKKGHLAWDVPAGPWTILRLVCANTGQGLAVPSPNSQGLAIDHFSSEATRMHFEHLIDKLRRELGTTRGTAMTTMYLCSYELRGAVWTPGFLDEFRRRRGYDMKPFLPALFGWTIQSKDFTERFQYDYRKTQGELLVDAFYRTAKEASNRHGFLLCAESGGPGPPLHQVPVDAIQALGAVDVPRGEFWTDIHLWVVKETACASHVYGKGVVDMESFTSWAQWQYGPFELKPFADRAMCDGANHFTFHTCPHHPPEAGRPGWVYHAGTHFGPSLVWWPKAKPFVDYLARSSYLLQQGLFVGDVCYYYGDQGYNFVPPKQVDPSLGFGYDYDVTNAEVILTRMEVRGGRLVLPDGLSYEILVLPDREDMDLAVLRKLEKLVAAGATIVGRKPIRCNGLTDYPRRDQEVRDLADRLWGPCDGQKVRQRAYGKGTIFWGPKLREILQARGVGPDFRFVGRDGQTGLDYVHRRVGDADIYFVSNKGLRWEDVDCTFRASGKAAELWMPDTGEICRQAATAAVEGGTKVPLRLPPAGSAFVVFREKAAADPIVSIRHDGRAIFPVSPGSSPDVPPCELRWNDLGRLELAAWESGPFVLETARGKIGRIEVPSLPSPREIAGPWEVRFPAGWGAPPSKTFAKLTSWTENPEDGIKHFSGIAAYHREFDLPADQLGKDRRLFLDLGRVRNVADVQLNGKGLGILWKPPYRVDVTAAVRPGRNRLVVEVANTWSNRLVGDAYLPKDKRYCRTNVDKSQTWKVPWKETPLLESGLLGPVRLLSSQTATITLK